MLSRFLFASSFVLALALPSLAHADQPANPQPQEEKKDEDRSVYLSFSPLHLILPVVELQGEVKLHRQIGVALIGGYGSVKATSSIGENPRFTVWEVGGQFVGYPVGHFDHGMQLGVELLYAGVSTDEKSGSVSVAGAANGLAVGPVVGYKLATKVGFSFNVQGGAEYVAMRAQASSNNGQTASARDSAIIPVLNLNVGWSF